MTKKPSVLYVLGNLTGGGAEYSMLELARLSDRLDAHVFAFSANGELRSEASLCARYIDASNRFLGPDASILSRVLYGSYNKLRKRLWVHRNRKFCTRVGLDSECLSLVNPSMVARLHALIGRHRPDVIVTSMMDVGGSFAMRCASEYLEYKPKWVVWEANYPQPKFDGWGLKRTSASTLFSSMYAVADRVVACSHGVADWLTDVGGVPEAKVETIYNGIRTSYAASLRPRTAISKASILSFVTIGRLHEQKRHDLAIRAIAKVNAVRPVRLRVLGNGALLGELQQLAIELGMEDCVEFLGHVDAAPILSAASGFLLSSDYEGYPNVLLEAMAAGVPCVATLCPCGPSEMIEDGVSGILVPVGDVDGMAAGILRVLEDSSAAETMGAAGRAWSLARTLNDTAADFKSLYCRLLEADSAQSL